MEWAYYYGRHQWGWLIPSRRARVSALESSAPSGSVQITHPFHPLYGQRFLVFGSRRVRGVEFLILQDSDSGTFSVQRAWTDQAFPDVYRDAQISPRILGIEGLLQLVDLLAAVEKNAIDL